MVSVCTSPSPSFSPVKGEYDSSLPWWEGASGRGIPHLDSRLRGNDRTGDRPRQNGFFALCVRNSLESLFDKEGLGEFGGIRG